MEFFRFTSKIKPQMQDTQLPPRYFDRYLNQSFVGTCWVFLTVYPISVYNNLFAQPNLAQLVIISALALSTAALLSKHETLNQKVKLYWFAFALSAFILSVNFRNTQDGALLLNMLLVVLFSPLFGVKRTAFFTLLMLVFQSIVITTLLPERNRGEFVTVLWTITSVVCVVAASISMSILLEALSESTASQDLEGKD